MKVQDFEAVGEGEFINWTYSLDMRGMAEGNHTIEARVIGTDGSQSLAYSSFYVVGNPPDVEERGLSASMLVPAVLVVMVVIALAILIYIKKKRGL